MQNVHRLRPLRYRTIFISDTHLGFRGARADFLLDFLRSTESETLYLVGDIFDIWEMERRGIHWPREHNLVLKTLFEKAANGTRVIYVPGNHDEAMREYDGTVIDNLHVHNQAVHETADGRRLLVLHGDEFDAVVQCSKLVALMGSRIYDWLLRTNYWINLVRRRLGFPYWSLAAHVKHRVKNAVSYISNFEEAVAFEARRRGVDGLVCGHIHHAEMRTINGVLYCNDGDWVESCTALVENTDGSLELLRWTDAEQAVHALEPGSDEVGEQAA